MKTLIRNILKSLDFGLHRISLQTLKDDPIYVSTKLFNPLNFKCVIDGGASVGSISKRLCINFPNAIIHAFEPYHYHFDSLLKLANENTRIVPIQKALSYKNGKNYLYINNESGTNSFLRTNQNGQYIYGDQLNEIGKIKVDSISLDEYLKVNNISSVDLLKLDLQGGEFDALKGADKYLESGSIKCIICEVMFGTFYDNQPSAGMLLSQLTDHYDYKLFNFYQSNYHCGKIIFSDALLIHRNYVDEIKKTSEALFHPHSDFIR